MGPVLLLQELPMKALSTQQRAVFDLTMQGYNVEQIAEELNVTRGAVHSAHSRLRKKGYDVGYTNRPGSQSPLKRDESANVGRLLQTCVNQMDRRTQEWVFQSIPDGATLSEFAVSCMIEEFYREMDDD
jgi:transposase